MQATHWYYLLDDDETVQGPLSLEQLCELIRYGHLPDDVLVSLERNLESTSWAKADTVEEILLALPFNRERLVREYIAYGEAPPGEEDWGWASARMFSLLNALPEFAWPLIIEMIDRAPSERSLNFIAASPLEDILSSDGPSFISRVEQRALENTKFRRALGMLYRHGMTDDVWRRIQSAAAS
jgi:hypothetical protein